jgi:hypothetical protein
VFRLPIWVYGRLVVMTTFFGLFFPIAKQVVDTFPWVDSGVRCKHMPG